jgi:arylsulfatase A-like enzyme
MKKPDIIFIHTDQWNANAFSIFEPGVVSTPASDRILAEGMRFDKAVATAPICVPNRTCWYTGLMPCEHGNYSNGWNGLGEETPDLGQWLSARGYDCHYGGKWHIGGRDRSGSFQVFCNEHPVGEVMDDGLAQSTEALLAGRNSDKPLFLNVGIMNPHDCCYLDFLHGTDFATKLGLQPSLGDDLPDNPPDYDPSQHTSDAVRWGPDEVRLYRYYYYRMCEMADQALARIHTAVRQYCDPENTILIYSSDHGEFNGHRNRFAKGLTYEPAQRVPLAISGPGIRAGSINTTHIPGAVDVTATILDYAGAELMPGMHFAASLRPVLEGRGNEPLHPYTPTETLMGGLTQTFRSGDYKCSFFARTGRSGPYRRGDGHVELYHLPSDPFENTNLAEDPAHAEAMDQFRGFWADFKSRAKPTARSLEEWKNVGWV